MKRRNTYIKKNIFATLIAVIVVTIIFYSYQLHKVHSILTIRLDTSNELTETQILQSISNKMPYLSIEDQIDEDNRQRNINASCAWYPLLSDLQIYNNYWQQLIITNVSYFIFAAYLDNRPTVVQLRPMIRLLTMINFIALNDEDYPKTFCQLWYDEQKEPIIMPIIEMHRLWSFDWGHELGKQYGHFVSCALPDEHLDWIPETVSLVAAPCHKATNNVRVIYQPLVDKKVKQEFVVYVKGFYYPYVDMSHRLVEYIEVLRALGADKIIMYNFDIHPNSTKILQYYQETGYVEYRPYKSSIEVAKLPEFSHLSGTKSYEPFMLQDIIPLNDCLYRNMYQYDYVAAIDIDEILMPLGNLSSWHDLIAFAQTITDGNCKKFASFCFRCINFPNYPQKPVYSKEVPNFFYMLQHVERVREHIPADSATKCLHNTDHVIAAHNHYALHTTDNACAEYSIKANNAQMQQYRQTSEKETLDDAVIDKSLWRIKDEVMERSMKVLKDLKFY